MCTTFKTGAGCLTQLKQQRDCSIRMLKATWNSCLYREKSARRPAPNAVKAYDPHAKGGNESNQKPFKKKRCALWLQWWWASNLSCQIINATNSRTFLSSSLAKTCDPHPVFSRCVVVARGCAAVADAKQTMNYPKTRRKSRSIEISWGFAMIDRVIVQKRMTTSHHYYWTQEDGMTIWRVEPYQRISVLKNSPLSNERTSWNARRVERDLVDDRAFVSQSYWGSWWLYKSFNSFLCFCSEMVDAMGWCQEVNLAKLKMFKVQFRVPCGRK